MGAEVVPLQKHKLQVSSKLGRGSFGVVYKGSYDGERVALKTIAENADDAMAAAAYKMFCREAAILQDCKSEHIIGFKALCRISGRGRGTGGGGWTLVLELAQGGTLADKITQAMIAGGTRTYSDADALRWSLQLAKGLAYLHGRSPAIVHRDVKLSNVLLVKQGSTYVAKVADFGLHQALGDHRERLLRISLTPGSRQGSFSYLPGSSQHARLPGARHGPPQRAASFTTAAAAAAGAPPAWPASNGNSRGGSAAVPHQSHNRAPAARSASLNGQQQFFFAGNGRCGNSIFRSDEDGSMCSMATDATWASECGTGVTGDSMDGDACSTMSGVETVFELTGNTGSALTMAPEVFANEPYNEKADVFSFGVCMYELTARCLVAFTELPQDSSDPEVADRYAARVAKGYRPQRPKRLAMEVWQVIEACWAHEPADRPTMAQVVQQLECLLAEPMATDTDSPPARFLGQQLGDGKGYPAGNGVASSHCDGTQNGASAATGPSTEQQQGGFCGNGPSRLAVAAAAVVATAAAAEDACAPGSPPVPRVVDVTPDASAGCGCMIS